VHQNHGHRHGEGEEGQGDSSVRLRLAFLLSAAILLVEVVGGILSNSLALLSDAGHVLTDVIALGLAWFAAAQALRPATPQRTFGFHRAGILAALANAVTLIVVSVFITLEAIRRLQEPEPINSLLMLGVAIVGLAVNLYVAFALHREPGENLNVRSALLHVVGDILASVAVIVGAIIIGLTGFVAVDPILSVIVAVIIVGGAWSVVLETVNILMEGTPSGVSLDKMIRDMRDTEGVSDVHDLHVWSLAAGVNAMSGHVVIADRALSESDEILLALSRLLAEKYGVTHVTIQFEHRECGLACTLFQNRLEAM